MKYAMGISPMTPVNPASLTSTTQSGDNLIFTYQKDNAVNDVTLFVQTSSDLSTWTNNASYTDVVVSTNGTVETREVTIPIGTEPVFTRLISESEF